MSRLEQLHPDVWRPLLKHLSLQDKKNLRLVNSTLYNLINESDDELKYVYKKNIITPAELRQIADDCPILLLDLECAIDPSKVDNDEDM